MILLTDRYNILVRATPETPGQTDHESPMITSPREQSFTTANYPVVVHTACQQEMERFIEDILQHSSAAYGPEYKRNTRVDSTPQAFEHHLGPLGYQTVVEREHFLQVVAWHTRERILYQHLPAHVNNPSACNNPITAQPAEERSLRSRIYNTTLRALELLVPYSDKAVP